MGGMGRAGCRAECATSTRSHKPARLVHTCLPRVLTPCSASLRTRPLCAVHRLVLLLPIPLPASRHRSHGSVMPLVPPRHHSLHCMSAHDIRRTLTACPIAPTSIHVACSFYSLLPPLRLIDSSLGPGPAPPTTFSRVAPPIQDRLTVRMVTRLRARSRTSRARAPRRRFFDRERPRHEERGSSRRRSAGRYG